MTALDQALTPTELTNAAGPHTIKRYLFPVAYAVVATAQVNMASILFPVAVLTVDNTSANWGNIRAGMTVFIGTAPGLSDIGIYRIRPDTISSVSLPISETSIGDSGTFPVGLRPYTIADNHYITIVSSSNFYSIIPLITGGVVKEDYNRTPGNNNTNPSPMVYVLCNAEHNHITVEVDSGQTYATIVFTASYDLFPTSTSAAYLWDAPAAWGAPTAGATNTATVTYQVPRNGITNDVLNLYVTEDSVAQFQQRTINVWVYEKTGAYAPITISDCSGDQWDDNLGYSTTLTLNDNLLASIPNGAMVMIKDVVTFNGATITSACDQFVGWLVRTTKHGEPGLRSAEVEFVGPAGLLNQRRGMSQIWGLSFSGWEYAPATVISLSYAMWWLLRFRARGVLENFDVNLYSTAPAGQRLPQIEVGKASLWQQLTGLADGIAKRSIGCDPDGTMWVTQHPSLVIYSSRSGLVHRDSLDASNIHDYDAPLELVPQVGWLNIEGFVWNGVSATPTPLLAIAPGSAPGQGPDDQSMQGQVVASQNDLDIVGGYYYALLNPDYSQPTLRGLRNRGALYKPAQRQMVRWQIPAVYEPSGVAFDRYIIPRTVRRTFTKVDHAGIVVDTQITPDIETAGSSAETVPVPQTVTQSYGNFSGVSTLPPATQNQAWSSNGATVFDAHGTTPVVRFTTNFLDPVPVWTTITGTGLTGNFCNWKFDPWSPRLISPTKTGPLGAYMLTTTGVFYTANLLVASPVWTQKQAVTVNDGSIKASINTQGVVYIGFHAASGANRVVKAKRLSAYGASIDWATDIGSALDGSGNVTFDIDSFGSDEMLIGGYVAGTGTDAYIYRISGGTPSQIAGTHVAAGLAGTQISIRFIQKPIKTLAGGDNSSTGGAETFFFSCERSDGDNAHTHFYKTGNGASSLTDIAPTVSSVAHIPTFGSAGAFVTTTNVIAFTSDIDNTLFTTQDSGTTWVHSSALGAQGYFPRVTGSGSYALYLLGGNYSPDFGATVAAKGTLGTAIPLY